MCIFDILGYLHILTENIQKYVILRFWPFLLVIVIPVIHSNVLLYFRNYNKNKFVLITLCRSCSLFLCRDISRVLQICEYSYQKQWTWSPQMITQTWSCFYAILPLIGYWFYGLCVQFEIVYWWNINIIIWHSNT